VQSGEAELDDVTLPLLMALERLSPLERAAFLLHDVFDLDFEEVAATIGREPAACRQLASRARAHVRADRPRYPVPQERGAEIAKAFFSASRDGDMECLRALLAADVTVYADGGGKVSAHTAPVAGIDDVMGLFATFASMFAESRSRLLRYGFINGLPGFVTIERGDILQTTALEIADGRVAAVYVVRNPDKLRHMADTVH
jgi:RNA polymerase sigma-70 factor (ECF subfamily)